MNKLILICLIASTVAGCKNRKRKKLSLGGNQTVVAEVAFGFQGSTPDQLTVNRANLQCGPTVIEGEYSREGEDFKAVFTDVAGGLKPELCDLTIVSDKGEFWGKANLVENDAADDKEKTKEKDAAKADLVAETYVTCSSGNCLAGQAGDPLDQPESPEEVLEKPENVDLSVQLNLAGAVECENFDEKARTCSNAAGTGSSDPAIDGSSNGQIDPANPVNPNGLPQLPAGLQMDLQSPRNQLPG